MKKTQENLSQEMDANVALSTKSKQKKIEEEMMNELRKQGVNVDMDFDTDFEDYIEEHRFSKYKDSYDEYGDDY